MKKNVHTSDAVMEEDIEEEEDEIDLPRKKHKSSDSLNTTAGTSTP